MLEDVALRTSRETLRRTSCIHWTPTLRDVSPLTFPTKPVEDWKTTSGSTTDKAPPGLGLPDAGRGVPRGCECASGGIEDKGKVHGDRCWYHWHEQLDSRLIPPRSCPTMGSTSLPTFRTAVELHQDQSIISTAWCSTTSSIPGAQDECITFGSRAREPYNTGP